MEKYLALLKEGGAAQALKIDVKTVKTAPWTIYRCHYGCDFYGKKPCCPPNSPSWKETQEILDCYQYGLLFCCPTMEPVTPLAIHVAHELFLDDYYRALAFGSGPCLKCKNCNPTHCNFPKQMVPAMESCGIDVFATARNNGLTIHALRDPAAEESHYYGLILVE